MTPDNSIERQLTAENAELRARLEDAEEMLRAIRAGEVDALVVESATGPQIYTLQGLDSESNRFRGDMLAQVSDAVIAVDLEERITFLNAAAERQYSVRADDVLGRRLAEIYTRQWPNHEAESDMRAALRESGEWRGELIHHLQNGRKLHVDKVVTALRSPDGATTGYAIAIRDITERHRAEAALQTSAAQLRLIADTAPVLIAHCDREHRYKFVNEPYAARFGLKPEQLLGRHIAEVVGEAAYEKIRGYIEKVLAGEAVEFEVSIPYENVGQHFMRGAYAPERKRNGDVVGFVAAILDITDRKRAEDVIRQNEALFSTIIEQAPGGVYVVDDQFRMMQINTLARPEFATAEPALGRDFSEVMGVLWGPELGPQIAEIFRHTLETGERYVSPRFTHERHDLGEEKSYEWETQRLTLPNGKRGVVCYFSDTTEQYAQEKALREAKESAEAANASKDRFLAVLSHELRTPLTPVLMVAGALEHDPELRSDVREDFVMIKRNVELEIKLIDDLLDLSRITSGKVVVKAESVDLNEVVRQVCGICQPQLAEHQVNLKVQLDQDVCKISADPARLQQVLWNVLKNAIKFTPAEGTVSVSTAQLDPERCEVRVQDSGIGIPADILPRIFNAFEQGDTHITKQFGGLGLGLAISRALVELHGGTIRAESEGQGRGATFIVELPSNAAVRGAEAPAVNPADDPGAKRIRLLLVEDHDDTARALARFLRAAGMVVVTSGNVASAIAAAEREPFDLVVSDLGLPDGDGYEIMRAVLSRRIIPGIAMSGYGMDEDIRRSREAGFTEHLVKPVAVPLLIAAIRRVTETRK